MSNLVGRMFFIAFMCLVNSSCEQDEMLSEVNENPISSEIEFDYNATELELLKLVNEHRISLDLNRLESSGLVSIEAVSHTVYMIKQQVASHDNFSVRTINLITNAAALSVGENVGYGYSSIEGFMNAWLNNDGHRKNIEGDYTHFGISAKKDDAGRYYVTQIFIER